MIKLKLVVIAIIFSSSSLFAMLQTIPIDQAVASLVTKTMSEAKPKKYVAKYGYRPESQTRDLLTLISSQKEDIRILQVELQKSRLETKKLEARIKLIELKLDKPRR